MASPFTPGEATPARSSTAESPCAPGNDVLAAAAIAPIADDSSRRSELVLAESFFPAPRPADDPQPVCVSDASRIGHAAGSTSESGDARVPSVEAPPYGAGPEQPTDEGPPATPEPSVPG